MKSIFDDAMAAAGKTQTVLAYECGVSSSLIQQWLRQSRTGNGRLPAGDKLKSLELSLQVADGRKLFPWDWP